MSKLTADLNEAFVCHEGCVVIETSEPREVVQDVTSEVYRRNKLAEDVDKSALLAVHDPVKGLCDAEGMPFNAGAGAQKDDIPPDFIPQSQDAEDALTAIKFFLEIAQGRLNRLEDKNVQPGDEALQLLLLKYFDRQLMPNGSDSNVDPTLLAATDHLRAIGAQVNVCALLLVQPGATLPAELIEYCAPIEHGFPENDERELIIADLVEDCSFSSDVSEEMVTATIKVTSGLSRAATERTVAKCLTKYKTLNQTAMLRDKGKQLAKRDLGFWCADMDPFVLWPVPDHEFSQYPEVICLAEETHQMNTQVPDGNVRVRVRYLDNEIKKEHWLDPMLLTDFEAQFRPERDYFSYKNWIGFEGVKAYMRRGAGVVQPDRCHMKGILFVGVPGSGKSFGIKCTAGELEMPVTSIDSSKLFSEWQGRTDKNLSRMLKTIGDIGGMLSIDEYQRFISEKKDDSGRSSSGDGGTSSRVCGTLLTWQNDQDSVFIFGCANDISSIPSAFTRGGRFQSTFVVGFPGREAKDAGWKGYRKRHCLEQQELPNDENWTVGEIAECCKIAEQQRLSLKDAEKYVKRVYKGDSKKEQDVLFEWAEEADCMCVETGEKFVHPSKQKRARASSSKATTRAPRRGVRKVD